MRQMVNAARTVFQAARYRWVALATAAVAFGAFVALPVLTIPGNSLPLQLSLFRVRDYLLMVALAVVVGINFAFQGYALRLQRSARTVGRSLAQGGAASAMGMLGAMLGTAVCASCLASVFGLIGLGAGAVWFVLERRAAFLTAAMAAMLLTLYATARKVNRTCAACPPTRVGK